MRDITFHQVGMQNFKGYREPMIQDFPPDEVILIIGPNGVGKTSIFDAIPFTFYGMTSSGARGDDVVNNREGKNCKTWVDFSINDIPYKVERYHKYAKHGNTVILYQRGEPIKKGHREVVEEIERMLMPQKLFMNTILFSQKVNTFFTDLKDAEQKEIFRKILILDAYVAYQKIAGEKISVIRDKIVVLKEELNSTVRLLEDTEIQEQEQLELGKEFERKKVAELEYLTEEMDGLREKLMESNVLCKKFEKIDIARKWKALMEQVTQNDNNGHQLLQKLKGVGDDLETKRSSKETEIKAKADLAKREAENAWQSGVNEEQSRLTEATRQSELVVTEANNTLVRLEADGKTYAKQKTDLLIQIEEIKDKVLKEKICPKCGQTIDAKIIETLKKDLVTYETSLPETEQLIVNTQEEMSKIQESVASAEQEIKEEKEKSEGTIKVLTVTKENELAHIDKVLGETLQKLEKAWSDSVAKMTKELEEQLEGVEEEREKLDGERKVLDSLLLEKEEAEKQRQYWFSAIETATERIKEKEISEFDDTTLKVCLGKIDALKKDKRTLRESLPALELEIDVLEFWKTGFSSTGIPSMLIDEAIPFMNETISGYLDEISGGRYTVSFDTLKATKAGEFRDKVSVNVFDNESWANARVQFSGGQVRIVDVATILTLRALQNNVQDMRFNLLLFDEIFDSLDDKNVEYVSTLLKTIKKGKTIFIISHKHIDQLEADQILQFTG